MAESVTITEDDDGVRLDRWIKKYYPDMAFGEIQKILRTGQLRVDGKRVKGDTRISEGQVLRIPPQMSFPQEKKVYPISREDAEFIQSLVLYKDDHIIAINKPAGLATQGGTKIKRHVDGMLEGLTFGKNRPHLVHRLDKDTSGVLLLARSPKAAKFLGDMFRDRKVRKYYWGITVPTPKRYQGKIKSVLSMQGGMGNEKMAPVDKASEKDKAYDKGKDAETYYQVMEAAGKKLAWVAFWPRTGRKHQIRVHALEMGCPLLGDYKYCHDQELLEEIPELSQMLHLHARRLIFSHPVTSQKMDITAPLGPDMLKTWNYFNFNTDDETDPFKEIEE